jgi:hypothetical protein
VKQGECLSSIAHQYGFRDYLTVWKDGANADLSKARPSPNLLHPGDVVVIPDKALREEQRPTGSMHQFRLKSNPRILRITLRHDDGAPVAGEPYELTCGGKVLTGSTNGDGKLEQAITKDAETATLKFLDREWNLNIAQLNPMEDATDDGISGCQARLRNLGYDPGPIDGIAGTKTERAVRHFQANHAPLVVDGICGPKTKAKLKELHGS